MFSLTRRQISYQYKAIDFAYHCFAVVYMFMAFVPAFLFLSKLDRAAGAGMSLNSTFFLCLLTLFILPLSFFRGVRRGRTVLSDYVRFDSIPYAAPSFFTSAVAASLRSASLPSLLLFPFVLAFASSSYYPIDYYSVFLLTPFTFTLLLSVCGVVASLFLCSTRKLPGNVLQKILNSLRESEAVSLVIPFLIMIPVLVNRDVLIRFMSHSFYGPVRNWFVLFSITVCEHWILQIFALLFSFGLLLWALWQLSTGTGLHVKGKNGDSLYRSMIDELGYSIVFSCRMREQEAEHLKDRNTIFAVGLLAGALEYLWFSPPPVTGWDRLLLNAGIVLLVSLSGLLSVWPQWQFVQGALFSPVIHKALKHFLLFFVTGFSCALIKGCCVEAWEYVMYSVGYFIVIGGFISLGQMIQPTVEKDVDSPGGGDLLVPELDGFVFFLMESLFIIVVSGWATGVHIVPDTVLPLSFKLSWTVVYVLGIAGASFFFIALPLWIFRNRTSSYRHYIS